MLTAPEFGFDEDFISEFNERALNQIRLGVPGLSERRLAAIESEWGFHFPPDLRWLLASSSDALYRWDTADRGRMKNMMDWPLEGMLFDVEHAGFWMPRWGQMPADLSDRLKIVRNDYRKWPRLIPIFSHRYIASKPCVAGNPVYSVYQTDIIFYGADLTDYLRNEFAGAAQCADGPVRQIEPWHTVIEMNC